MMKPFVPTLCLAALTACTSGNAGSTTETPAQTRRAITQLLATQTAAWNRGDVAGFMQGYWRSDSLVFIGKSGLTYGWQPTLDNHRRSYPNPAAMGQLRFEGLRVTPDGPEAAHVVGRWHLTRPGLGDLQGHYLLVLRHLNGQWVIVADHSS
ncbi:nuclear transport factor 2 family protein [Hymenobacter tibetensis]|uniref:Nuclear transport factor 2 family protein n=1 Tax=Hymenobacter tibetensis TaxID=497967 RepID=A0ABY4D3G4_9BACT|nr:nuclear transport factor 2 family protein [Hymenobacter tibetensis]UOG77074.1 nuclear transport factor 2 family protein [Hymenobacter tibetensis]